MLTRIPTQRVSVAKDRKIADKPDRDCQSDVDHKAAAGRGVAERPKKLVRTLQRARVNRSNATPTATGSGGETAA